MGNHCCDEGKKEYCLLKVLFSPERVNSMNLAKLLKGEDTMDQEILEDISDECKVKCNLKQIASKYYTEKEIEQLRCIWGDHKHVLGEKYKREVSPDEAGINWVNNGNAEKFAEVYAGKKLRHERIKHWDLYCETENKVNGR